MFNGKPPWKYLPVHWNWFAKKIENDLCGAVFLCGVFMQVAVKQMNGCCNLKSWINCKCAINTEVGKFGRRAKFFKRSSRIPFVVYARFG